MRAISRAVVVLGTLLLLAGTALPKYRSRWLATVGIVVGLIGLVAWAVAYLVDRRRDRVIAEKLGHSEPR